MSEEKYKVEIKGVRPLLMHSCNSMMTQDNSPQRSKSNKPKEEAEMLKREGIKREG